MMPKRIQRQRIKGWRMPEGVINVTRPGQYGNPFIVGRVPMFGDVPGKRIIDAEEAVELFRLSLNLAMRNANDAPPWAINIIGRLQHLRGKDLACWCDLKSCCHGDVLLDLANR